MRFRVPLSEVRRRVAFWEAPASYIVFTDSDRYYVKNGGTGELEYSDVDAVKAVQHAINKVIDVGGGTIVLKGEFYFRPFTGPTQYGDALIAVLASNVRLRIVGDEAVLHLPQNNTPDRQVWLFTVLNQSLDEGVGRVSFENLYVVDDVNTGAKPSNFLVSSGKGVNVEIRNCVFRFNHLGGFGIWLNDALGASVVGCRFLEVGGRTAILFDTVALGKVSDCLFISRKYGWKGIAISFGTGNAVVTNSEFYGLDTVFHFGDVDGETTLSASNNIFGVERRHYFTKPDGSAWILLPLRLIDIRNVSNLRINIDNSYIASEIFIAGDSPTGRVIDVYVGNSIVLGGVSTRVYQNPDGYPVVNLHFDNCQFGLADLAAFPVVFSGGGFDWDVSRPLAPVNYFVRNSRIYTKILYDYYNMTYQDVKRNYVPMQAVAVFENNFLYVRNTSATRYIYCLVTIGAEDFLDGSISIATKLRGNRVVLDGPITLYFACNPYTANASRVYLDLIMLDNEISYLNGASLGGEVLGIGNYARTMVKRNVGHATESSGAAVLPAGSTRITVPHGLVMTPTKILVTPLGAPPGKLWVENVTATSFDIVTDVAPTADLSVAWHAEV